MASKQRGHPEFLTKRVVPMVQPKEQSHMDLVQLLARTNQWNMIFDRHRQAIWEPDSVTDEDAYQTDLDVAEVLKTILTFFADSARSQEQWDLSESNAFPFGVQRDAAAKKQGHVYTFGIEYRSFFLESTLHSPWTIKFMAMNFWRHLVDLDTLGTLELVGLSVPTIPPNNKAFRHLLTQSKNPLYCLIRNLVLIEATGPDPDDSRVGDEFVRLKLSWKINDIPWEELLQNGALAFQHLYQMNYLLYRHHYQTEHAYLAKLQRQRPTARPTETPRP
jgi:hypothetical protein